VRILKKMVAIEEWLVTSEIGGALLTPLQKKLTGGHPR
jgi:hypothetical protein